MLVDLQVGLTGKDGAPVDPATLIEGVKKAGLDGVVFTDAEARFPAVQPLRELGAQHGVTVFAGARIPTNRGLLLAIVPDAEKAGAWQKDEGGTFDAEAVINAVEDNGGVIVALRPYDRDVPKPMGDHIFTLSGLTACETQSGSLTQSTNELALEAASNLELPCVGTSGAEGLDGLGTAATLFRTAMKSEADLVEAIRHGDCWPVTFSTRVPEGDNRARGGDRRGGGGGERRGGGGGGGGERSDERGGRRRRRRGGRGGGGGGGPRREGEGAYAQAGGGEPRADRGGEGRGDRGGEGRGDRGGRRGRRGGGGGGGGGGERGPRLPRAPRGPLPEDIGNRVSSRQQEVMDEDFGNKLRSDEGPTVDENIGNRLRPGQESIFAPKKAPVEDFEDDDDNVGNR
ncbi:MAG: PHP-associated domain-containing protein [Myxococcota bacterium]